MRLASRCLLVVVILYSARVQTAAAATNCSFETRGSTWLLKADCQTDQTLRIPDGFTLDGRGRSITALDPAGGHFVGAIVRNAGLTAHVRNLTLDTRALSNVCDPDTPSDDRLRGILFETASGSIIGNRVRNIRQGESGCQEGFGIEARNPPYDGSSTAATQVFIASNRVEAYQKVGILVSGAVEARIYLNVVVGLGAVDFIAQNGIQLGFGARGQLKLNRISQNLYLREETQAAGILLVEAGEGVEVSLNHVDACDTGIALSQSSDVLVSANRISDSARYGMVVFGDANALLSNRILRTQAVGIYVSGEDNALERNVVRNSSELDIYNMGDNDYASNQCGSSSGPPVNCP